LPKTIDGIFFKDQREGFLWSFALQKHEWSRMILTRWRYQDPHLGRHPKRWFLLW